jgi:hypothetical protein
LIGITKTYIPMSRSIYLTLLLLCFISITPSLTASTPSELSSRKVKRSLRYYNFEYRPGDDDYYKQLEKKEKEAKNTDDDMTFTEKVHKMEQNAKSELYTIGTTSPGQWAAKEWLFFFLLVGFSCGMTFLLYGAIFGFRRRLEQEEQDFGYHNVIDARGNRLEFPTRPMRSGDSDDDTIMRARSID